jgi:hypothetical protein
MATNQNRSKYFARTVVYTKREGEVVLVDMHDASVTQALDPWLGKVLLLADGSHTVEELIAFVGKSYPGGPPSTLEATLDSVISRLSQAKAIVFSDEAVTLPYYLALPADDQDPERSNRLMLEDGFQQAQPEGLGPGQA